MGPRAVRAGVALALLAAVLRADRYDDQIPAKPQRPVTDRAGVLSAGQPEALSEKIDQFERETSNQVLVWIDRKLPEGFTLEDFTVRAGQKWGAGQKQDDNGAILFVFVDDRKVRMEVGYGLEGALPDITAKRIIEEQILPRFRAGDYPGGVEDGVNSMIAAIKGEYRGTGKTVDERRRGGGSAQTSSCLLAALFFGVFILLPILMRKRRAFRTHGGRGWWTGGGWGGGGWSGGGWGGGGGWSGGGGGWSGGGGSFGGGGASGSW
jgi:uncharacterized protein